MLERWLDALVQYRRRLVVALLLVPSLVVAAGFGLNRTQPLTARIWVNPPVLLLTQATDGTVTGTPAAAAAALLREVVGSDALLTATMADADPGFRRAGAAQQTAMRRALRANLGISTDGDQVIALTYRTDQPILGEVLLNGLIRQLEGTALATLVTQSSTPSPGREADLLAARRAIEGAFTPRAPTDLSSVQLLQTYLQDRMRSAPVHAATDAYRRQLAAAAQTTPSASGVSALQTGLLAVTDPPASRAAYPAADAARFFTLGLLMVLGAATVLLLGIAATDARIRSASDVETRAGWRYLGSTPPTTMPATASIPLVVIGRCLTAFRSLIAADRARGAVIAVVSPNRGDGRSTIAAGLALAIGRETEQPVLLLKRDLAHPDQGAIDDSCRERFRWIVVDLPPAGEGPWPEPWCRDADAYLVVGRHRRTPVAALERLASRLPAARPAGFLMTADTGVAPWLRRWL